MGIFNFDNVKAEKANAMLRYRRLRSIAKWFRFVELCVLLIFLSWISTRLPFAVKILVEYFRRISTVIASPVFVFLLINVIILALFVNSGRFPGRNRPGNDTETELYEEFVKNSDTRTRLRSENHPLSHEIETETEKEEIVYQDKQIVCEVNAVTPTSEDKGVAMVVADTETETKKKTKAYRRSQSEKLKRERSEKLRRSETEKCREIVSSGEEPAEDLYAVDGLSNEEFQRVVDEFIAKQMKFHRDERVCVALQMQS